MSSCVETLQINGVEYVRADRVSRPETVKQIVILQRGWVMVGDFEQRGENCLLHNASVIRVWGTTKGLGELALNGPTEKTVLDPCGTARFHELTIVARLDTRGWVK